MTNALYYGDNLDILRNREYFPDTCVDLIYLDPPFNSSRSYNVLFKDESGLDSDAQITAFEDTWHWGEAAQTAYRDLTVGPATPQPVSKAIAALRDMLGTNQMMAYLVMMAARLVELHRVLKPTGSLYLHCDPTASHYLKMVLDMIFGAENFRNEIIWQRTSSHNDTRRWGAVHDTLFFYSKGSGFTWNPVFTGHDPDYVARFYRHEDERGVYRLDHIIRSASMGPRPNLAYEYKGYTPQWGWRVVREKLEALDNEGRIQWSRSGRPYLKRYLHEQEGMPIKSVITDVPPIGANAAERLGYPTQKPQTLLERIITASSNPDDIVLDPFCGCGTAIAAAHKLARRWIGIDITHLSIALQKYRLRDMFDLTPGRDYAVIGEPTTVNEARALAHDDDIRGRWQFQAWALSLVQAKPIGGKVGTREIKKGGDRGVDGVINFMDNGNGKFQEVLVQVKSGKVKPADVRDLRGTMERRKSAIGVLITLEEPTDEMKREAASADFYHSPGWNRDYPRMQILTIEQLLSGAEVKMPPPFGTFKQAERVRTQPDAQTLSLFPDDDQP
jgi:site-specific DNA-methyltransferase (adenine-specific)